MRALAVSLLLLLAACGDAPADPEAPPAAEVIALAHVGFQPVPLAEGIAAARGVGVETGADSVQRVPLGEGVTLAVYPSDARTLERLQATPAPAAAVFVVSGADGPFQQHREQAQAARQAGVPVAAAVIGHLDLIDDAELIDLVQMETDEMLTQAGAGGVPVTRLRISASSPGGPADRAALQGLADALRDAAR